MTAMADRRPVEDIAEGMVWWDPGLKAQIVRALWNERTAEMRMTPEDALDAVWPNWRNPIAPNFVSGISRSVEEAIAEMEREARAEGRQGGWNVRLGTFRRLTRAG